MRRPDSTEPLARVAVFDAAGARRIRLHDVRHTYATLSLDAGINPKKVRDRIGAALPPPKS